MATNIEDLEYIGGLFDGEGYAGVVPCLKKKRFRVTSAHITISMSDPEPIYLVSSILGGKVSLIDRRPGAWKPQYNWTVTCFKAVTAALKLFPFVRTARRKQALLDVINKYMTMTNANFSRTMAIVKTKSEG